MNPDFPSSTQGINEELCGADSRIRTDDLIITNDLLYQLSYIGIL
jgi:hypothetical protein